MSDVALRVSFVPTLHLLYLVIQALTVKTFRSDLSHKLAGGRFVPMHKFVSFHEHFHHLCPDIKPSTMSFRPSHSLHTVH
jgi:hypothetical protein